MSQIKLGTRMMLGIPTLKNSRRSIAWEEAMSSLQMPLGNTMAREWTEDQEIADARNALCKSALDMECDYLFMLGDDVLAPPPTLLAMLDKIGRTQPVMGVAGKTEAARVQMITGVYWTKTYPPEPYLFNGLLKGSHKDWKVGEFFPVDFAGCDCLLIETDVLRKVPFPWFSTDWVWEPGQKSSSIATEDYYFYTKCREYGIRLFADTAIQCGHEDRNTGAIFGIHMEMPQVDAVGELLDVPKDTDCLVADIGAGLGTNGSFFGNATKIVRFDMRADVRPDVQCDIRSIPDVWFGKFDVVSVSHVLEHFRRSEAKEVLQHWAQLLKVGGKMVIQVPDFERAILVILDSEYLANKGAKRASAAEQTYAWAQIFGDQEKEGAPWEHKNGFTTNKLKGLLRGIPEFGQITVEDDGTGQNLKGTAILERELKPYALTEAWERINARP